MPRIPLLAAAFLAAFSTVARAEISFGRDGSVHPIVMLSPGLGLCSGTVIGPDIVLTAAHCVHGQNMKAPNMLARAPEEAWSATVSEIFPHPEYDRDLLLKLARELEALPAWSELKPEQKDKARELARRLEKLWSIDLAIVRFSRPYPQKHMALGRLGGQAVTFIGYGGFFRGDPERGSEVKREGETSVQLRAGGVLAAGGTGKLDPKAVKAILSLDPPTGAEAKPAAPAEIVPGDSGGGVVQDGKLVGVMTGYTGGGTLIEAWKELFGAQAPDQNYWNLAVDLGSESSVRFLESAVYKGYAVGGPKPLKSSP